jgi:hypothetical protein
MLSAAAPIGARIGAIPPEVTRFRNPRRLDRISFAAIHRYSLARRSDDREEDRRFPRILRMREPGLIPDRDPKIRG